MSALLCCGPCFDSQYLTEDGLIYPWLDSLLISMDEKVNKCHLQWKLIYKLIQFNLKINCKCVSTICLPNTNMDQ